MVSINYNFSNESAKELGDKIALSKKKMNNDLKCK